MPFLTHEQRADMITTHAWETWTRNGATCWDAADREHTAEHVRDAVEATYEDDIDDMAWLKATLKWLDNYEPPTGAPQDDPDFAGYCDNN